MGAHPLAVLAWIAALRGDDPRCRELADQALQLAQPRGMAVPPAIATWALAELELGAGRWEDALGHLEELRVVRPGFGHPAITNLTVPSLVEAAVRAGRPEVAAEPLAAFAAWVERTGSPYAPARLARCRALLAATADESVAHYEDALALEVQGDSPFEQARTQLLYGELLRRLRRRADAREHLRNALRTFERVGAARWFDRAQGELRATGETARKRDPSALGQLTPQEQQIARLVGEGASNKDVAAQLFLSPRTVEYHLRKVFMKLGIASRADLIRQGIGGELATVPR
jgi:DNA-binding NarL/FixJ family response regulator